MSQQNSIPRSFTVRADELTEGDIIESPMGYLWQVLSEPEYTELGICFEVMWLAVEPPDNTQTVCFASEHQFELTYELRLGA